MRRYLTSLSGLALLGTSMAAAAVTWIEDFRGKPDDFRFERGTQRPQVQIYQYLESRDRLTVLKEGSVLYLRRDDGSQEVITNDKPPYEEPGQLRPPGPLSNLWTEISRWLSKQRVNGADRPMVISLVTRGEPIPPIDFPLAPLEKARLGAGTYPLYLAWSGGQSPYEVSLIRADGTELVKHVNIAAPGGNNKPFTTAPLNLAAGQYQLIIRDAIQERRIALEVLPTTALPIPPATLSAVDATDVRQTVEALWLASQDEAWRLEAYQRVMPLEAQHGPARLVRYSLEKGETLPPINKD